MTSFADSVWRFHIYFACVMILTTASISLIFVRVDSWMCLWLGSLLYTTMMFVSASCESVQSSCIPVFMRNGIDGKKSSSESMLLTNAGYITVLMIGIAGNWFGGSLQAVIFVGGLCSLCASVVSSVYFWEDAVEPTHISDTNHDEVPKQENVVDFMKNLSKFPETLTLCISWILSTCSMTNFMVNLNLVFRTTITKVKSSDLFNLALS